MFDIFSYFCSKHRLWVHVRTASPRSNKYPQSMFYSKKKKKRKIDIPLHTPVLLQYIQVGYKGVYITQTCYCDDLLHVWDKMQGDEDYHNQCRTWAFASSFFKGSVTGHSILLVSYDWVPDDIGLSIYNWLAALLNREPALSPIVCRINYNRTTWKYMCISLQFMHQ